MKLASLHRCEIVGPHLAVRPFPILIRFNSRPFVPIRGSNALGPRREGAAQAVVSPPVTAIAQAGKA